MQAGESHDHVDLLERLADDIHAGLEHGRGRRAIGCASIEALEARVEEPHDAIVGDVARDRDDDSALRVAVPLNTRCSIRWDIPPRFSDSWREPVSTQTPTATERTCSMRSVTTRMPLARKPFR